MVALREGAARARNEAPGFAFSTLAQDGKARLGRLCLAHGSVKTPAFMPVGTAGSVKGLLPGAVAQSGAEIILGNTYHLMLRPGAERIARLGGLRRFMGWEGPLLTDSGGFQVMSLAPLCTCDEDGVRFRSHIDGTEHTLTPERAIDIQRLLGADIAMALDECIPAGADRREAARAMRLSMRWAARARKAFDAPGEGGAAGGALFGIQQGGLFGDLREESAGALRAIGFDGYAIGGLAVGEGREAMFGALDLAAPMLPESRPRYLMGVGKPEDILGAVQRGIDMFDCVLPTRSGRTGQAFTSEGELNLKNACHVEADIPLDGDCACPCCRNFSRAYLAHLFRAGEMLGPILLTTHNLYFYQSMMRAIRAAIAARRLGDFAKTFTRRRGAL